MIKSILFDSGRVLNRPLTGHWFISPNFFKYVNKEKFLSIEKERINNAFSSAQKYLFNEKLIKNREEELIHFSNFYKLFSENLPELQINNIEDLAKDMVYNTSKYVFYEDVKEVIPRLKNKYKMAVVSDAWPSLENVFIDADMKKYFEIIVISTQIGTLKPDPRMYETAIERLQVNNSEAIFIDDNINNCLGAERLGIKSILMSRENFNENKEKNKTMPVVKDLYELEQMLQSVKM